MKGLLKSLLLIILLILGFSGAYHIWLDWYTESVLEEVETRDRGHKEYDPDFMFNKKYAEPFIRVNPGYTTTLYIFGGFRGFHYYDFFEELHRNEKVNIIAPVTGLTGWPVRMRTRKWYYQEDMREHIQMYEIYTSRLPKNHRVVTMSMSFGALPHATIAVRAQRKPEAMLFLSPLNTGLDYRAASPVVAWLSSKIDYLKHIIPVMIRSKNPARAGMWDVVNDEKNLEGWEAYGPKVIKWEENLDQAVEVRRAGNFLIHDMIPRVQGRDIVILHGDDDLVFSEKGFAGFEEALRKAGNRVNRYPLKDTGHMVLNDNGGEKARQVISEVLQSRYVWKE